MKKIIPIGVCAIVAVIAIALMLGVGGASKADAAQPADTAAPDAEPEVEATPELTPEPTHEPTPEPAPDAAEQSDSVSDGDPDAEDTIGDEFDGGNPSAPQATPSGEDPHMVSHEPGEDWVIDNPGSVKSAAEDPEKADEIGAAIRRGLSPDYVPKY